MLIDISFTLLDETTAGSPLSDVAIDMDCRSSWGCCNNDKALPADLRW